MVDRFGAVAKRVEVPIRDRNTEESGVRQQIVVRGHPVRVFLMRRLLFFVTAVYTALLITRPHEFLPSLAESSLLQWVLLGAFTIWLTIPEKGIDLPQFWIIPPFLTCVWLSLGFAGWWGGIVPALERMAPPILLFVIITGCIRSVGELKNFSYVIIACASVLVLHGHLQRTTGAGWTGQPMIDGRITYSGIFNDPNDIGLLIVLSVALTVYQLRIHRSRFIRLIMWATFGWLLYGVYLTDSRGTMLAVMAVLALEAWKSYGKTVVIAAGAIALPLLIAFTRLAELNAEEASAENRIDAWYEGIQMLMDHPVFGVGWGMFSDYNFITAHNSFVLAMAELGFVGYIFWFALVLLSGLMIYRLAFPANQALSLNPEVRSTVASGWGPPAAQKAAPRSESPATGWARERQQSNGAGSNVRHTDQSPALPNSAAAVVNVDMEQIASRALLFAAIGFAVGAFFLSQSYKAMLFINCGLIAGRYLGTREAGLPVPSCGLLSHMPLVIGAALGSVIGLWVLVRVLL